MPSDKPSPAMIFVGATIHARMRCCSANGLTAILLGNACYDQPLTMTAHDCQS